MKVVRSDDDGALMFHCMVPICKFILMIFRTLQHICELSNNDLCSPELVESASFKLLVLSRCFSHFVQMSID